MLHWNKVLLLLGVGKSVQRYRTTKTDLFTMLLSIVHFILLISISLFLKGNGSEDIEYITNSKVLITSVSFNLKFNNSDLNIGKYY